MTKEEQIAQFGIEVPEKYQGFVFGRDPPWSAEHFQLALQIAQSYDYETKILKKDTTVQ